MEQDAKANIIEEITDDLAGIEAFLSVDGQIHSFLRFDIDIVNALVDDLLAFIEPYGNDLLYSTEPRTYRTTIGGRAILTEAIQAGSVGGLGFGVEDPEMPVEFRGSTQYGPHVSLGVGHGGELGENMRLAFAISLAPRWSDFQAGLAKRLLALIHEWAIRVDASQATVVGANE